MDPLEKEHNKFRVKKLYGKKSGYSTLHKIFKEHLSNETKLVIVKGETGIGKTTFCSQIPFKFLKKTSTKKGGQEWTFGSGSYEAVSSGVPCKGLYEAIRSIISKILSGPEKIRDQFKERILKGLGSKIFMAMDASPELKEIFPGQQDLDELLPREREIHFINSWVSLIRNIVPVNGLLCIILDDFDYADITSIKIIEKVLLEKNINNILIVVTINESEFSQYHPKNAVFQKIEKKFGKIPIIHLHPLDREVIKEWLVNAYPDFTPDLDGFINLLSEKSKGNSLYISKLLQYIDQTGLLHSIPNTKQLEKELQKIPNLSGVKDLRDLIKAQLGELPKEMTELLTYAALSGARFTSESLSKSIGESSEITIKKLEKLSENQLVDKDGDIWKFHHGLVRECVLQELSPQEASEYKQKVAKSLFTESLTCYDLIQITNLLIDTDVTNWDEKEREKLLEMYMSVGIGSEKLLSHQNAIKFLNKAIELLNENYWNTSNEKAVSIFRSLAMAQYLQKEPNESISILETCMKNAKTDSALVDSFTDLSAIYLETSEFEKIIQNGHSVLETVGIPFQKPTPASKLWHFVGLNGFLTRIRGIFSKNKNQRLASLPLCKDEKTTLATKVFALMFQATSSSQNLSFYNSLLGQIEDIVFEQGVTIWSLEALLSKGFLAQTPQNIDLKESYNRGKTILELGRKYFPNTKATHKIEMRFYSSFYHLKHPYKAGVVLLNDISEKLLSEGLIGEATYSFFRKNCFEYAAGSTISETLERCEEDLNIVKTYSSEPRNAGLLQILIEYFKTLQGEETSLDDRFVDLRRIPLENPREKAELTLISEIYELFIHFYFHEIPLIRKKMKTLLEKRDKFPDLAEWPQVDFIFALSLIERVETVHSDFQDWKHLVQAQSRLETYANICPTNFKAFSLIIRAEILRLKNKIKKSIQLHEKALEQSKQSGHLPLEALIHEKLANIHLSQKEPELASYHLQLSLSVYKKWGAIAKGKILQKQFPDLYQTTISGDDDEEALSVHFVEASHLLKTIPEQNPDLITASSDKMNLPFDYNTYHYFLSSVSQEVTLDNVLETLARLFKQLSDADRVFIVINDERGPLVHSFLTSDKTYHPLVNPIPAIKMKDDFSYFIVNEVCQTKNKILHNELSQIPVLKKDEYLQKAKPKAILCIPILQAKKLKGVLYLESLKNEKIFTEEKITFLSKIAEQIIPIIEKSKFFTNLELKLREINNDLQRKNQEINTAYEKIHAVQKQMIQQEKLASLGLLTSGIGHELKNPLNFVINFAKIAEDGVKELGEELQKSANLDEDQIALFTDLRTTLGKVHFHGTRADDVIKSMLLHTRGSAVQVEKIDINKMLLQALNLTYSSYRKKDPTFNCSIEKNFEQEIKLIEGYPGELIRVFINIMDNAFFAMAEKKVKQPDYSPKMVLGTSTKENKVIISLMDNAMGIPESAREKIFRPFFTTKPTGSGTGLGLSIVYNIIVEQHNGSIDLDSQPGEFTIFTIGLPLSLQSSQEGSR